MLGPNFNRKNKIVVKFKGFIPRTKAHNAKKVWFIRKKVDFASADIECSLCVRLKNFDW